ncbi:hypothetical protein [Methylobacterium brachythecii]|uniref:Uncharacterized protein n=1 Tax=Methylobacterium brachythecii TaxID=1176177 RepID=A0A7W6ADL9_9HYPH|nr:hypothetical protein [Methylobacterium brachythecii]MBB3901347.1 hypothetical protein [Methylobacterium brachythecii]GLS42921.1 hypothetical protein GCM10007884_09060 [Methylobacterium brachythecii]
MFSLHMYDRDKEPVRKRDHPNRLSGMALGFASGLTVIIALDVFVLNNALFREMPSLHWYMPQVIRSAVALPWR